MYSLPRGNPRHGRVEANYWPNYEDLVAAEINNTASTSPRKLFIHVVGPVPIPNGMRDSSLLGFDGGLLNHIEYKIVLSGLRDFV